MKLGVKYLGEVTVVSVDSSVLQDSVPILITRLEDLISTGRNKIIIDLINAEYLSSVGLSAIIDIQKQAKLFGGDLVLCSANHLICNLLDMTNMTRLILLFEDIGDAEAYLISGTKKED